MTETLTRAEKLRTIDAVPLPPNTYPTDTLQTVRDAVITQSQRALEMARQSGLGVPHADANAAL